MTKIKIGPDDILKNFLRNRLTDINGSRSGQWIYTDFPRTRGLGDASFPRVGITVLSGPGEFIGMSDDDTKYNCTLQLDIVKKKDLGFTITTTAEALGTMSSTVNSDRFTYDFIPTAVTNIKHNGTSYGTVTLKNTDALFTAPGSLTAGIVEVSRSTGNLNFSSTDVSSHDGEAITSTYTKYLEGKPQVTYLGGEVLKAIKNNWKTDDTFKGLYLEKNWLLDNRPMPLEEDFGIFRHMIVIKCYMYNWKEGI